MLSCELTVDSLNGDRHEERAVLGAVVGFLQVALLVHLALDAVLQFITATRACWALLAVSSRVSDVLLHLALAAPTTTGSMSGTNFAVRSLAGLFRRAALASVASPAIAAFAMSTLAGAVIGSRAENRVVTIAREVVALAEFTGDVLSGSIASVAVTLTAHAVASAAAFDVGLVVGSALVES